MPPILAIMPLRYAPLSIPPKQSLMFKIEQFFFFISKNSIESAKGRNPSTHEVYKSAPNQRKETNKKVNNQRTTYYPGSAPTPQDITY
jgi:hypothetical protein